MGTEYIWDEFRGQLFSFIRARTSNEQIAEDLLQDVFVKIHLKRNGLREQEKLTSWLYQITRNAITDYYRRENTRAFSYLPDTEDEEENFNDDYLNCIKPFINFLPDNYKDVLMQTVYGKLSQKEYAQANGLSYSTVKSRVQRGRQKLKELFLACCELKYDRYGNIYESEKRCAC